jgi:RNA polymerase sigma-32 factor
VPLEDLIQQGNLGLLKAASKYEPERSCRLVTYAAYWIRAEIRDYVTRSYRIVRLGSTRTERRAMRTYRREGVDSPEQLAEQSGMPLARAEKLWPLLREGDMPLDARPEGRVAPANRIHDHAPTPEEIVDRQRTMSGVREALEGALSELTDRERRIVSARMLAEETSTLEELGREMGVSKERVRQLEDRARRKLRAKLADFEPQAA